jgi:protein-tyrosine-phosphatase
MPTIVFVCTANICRSPVAQALFSDWVRRRGLANGDKAGADQPQGWRVLSAGTWAEPGALASTYSRAVLAEQGLDLAAHRAQRVDGALMAQADLVVCMTRSHCEALRAEFPRQAARIVLLSHMAGLNFDVADPYGGPRRGYEEMVQELRDLVERGGPRMAALAGAPAG